MDKFLPYRNSLKVQFKFNPTLLIWLGLMLFTPVINYAQTPDCGCKGQVNVNLNDDCEFRLTTAIVEAGDCGDNVRIIVNDGVPNGEIVDCAGLHDYGVFDSNDRLVCWGRVLAEDKTAPVVDDIIYRHRNIECVYLDQLENNPETIDPDSEYYLGQVIFEDNCGDCGCFIERKFNDQIFFENCTSDDRTAYARMVRRWTATDCEGNQTIQDQTFTFFRPRLNNLSSVSDTTIQTCNPASINNIATNYPFWIDAFGKKLFLDEVTCNYSLNVSDRRFSNVCTDGSYKIERTINVLDWCTGNSRDLTTYVIKVGDFEGPEFEGHAMEIEPGSNTLNFLESNYNRSDFEDFEEAGKLKTIPTVGSSCSASFFTTKSSLESLFGFQINDCADVDISVSIYTYGPRIIFGFPTGNDEWQETNYPMFNNVASGIPVGLHALVLEVSDGCKNSATGIVFFKVKDRVPPIMKCDDQLTVSVTTGNPLLPALGAYARVDAVDVDEGSEDNCGEIDRLLVRRSVPDLAACLDAFIALGYDSDNDGDIDEDDYFDENNNGQFDEETEFEWEFVGGEWFTPWREFAEFFCCDVDNSVVIELRAWDNAVDPLSGMEMPNFNTCWLDIVIEDDIDPTLSSLPDVVINCDDSLVNILKDGIYNEKDDIQLLTQIRERLGAAITFGTTCGSTSLEEEITTFFDPRCPTGYIEREIRVSKTTDSKGTSTTSTTQRIDVVIKHDYWICFPPDVTADCDDQGSPDIPGVTFSEGTCDLLAISQQPDEPFGTGDLDNGCFKIFRTYRIINWCEYDGISPAIKVSRDWDGPNGTNPKFPDGDDEPGDEGICVIVKRDFLDGRPDTTWYDRDTDPYNLVPGFDEDVSPDTLSYWWRVISGSNDPDDPDYYDGPFDNNGDDIISAGEESTWRNDPNDNGGANDDDDFVFGSNGYWEYTQHIKFSDSTPPEIMVTGQDSFPSESNFDCAGDVVFTFTLDDNCTPIESLTVQVFLDVNNDGGTLLNVTNEVSDGTFNDRYPIGEHKLIFQTIDQCGNRATEEVVFTVYDGLATSPICSNNLIVNLEPTDDGRIGIKDIWATDFTQNSAVGDCTGQGPEQVEVGDGVFRPEITKFSINRKGEPYEPDSTGLFVTCADAGQLVAVEVHAIDEAGNHAFCNTFIEVQDNNNLCPGGATQAEIAGIIGTEQGSMMADVEVRLSGPINMMDMTNNAGEFSFSQLEVGYDYTVKPEKNDGIRNGVSISDLILVKRHVLGLDEISNPYQQIAADVNNSGTITVKDMIELQRLILYKIDAFEGNTSWRFVDEKFQFGANPLANAFPEAMNVNNLKRDMMSTNFIAIKVGDPSESAATSGSQALQPRSAEHALNVFVEDQQLVAGEEYTFFLEADISQFQGFQFTLGLEQVELVDIQTGLLSEEQLGVFTDKGMITAAWYDVESTAGAGNTKLFGVTIRAKNAIALSEVVRINSRLTTAEAVKTDLNQVGNVQIDFEQNSTSSPSGFALYDNQPNPFKEETLIGFELPEDSDVNIRISDVNGRIVKTLNAKYNAGYNQIQLNARDLPAPGIYYLTLRSGDNTVTKRLVNIR